MQCAMSFLSINNFQSKRNRNGITPFANTTGLTNILNRHKVAKSLPFVRTLDFVAEVSVMGKFGIERRDVES